MNSNNSGQNTLMSISNNENTNSSSKNTIKGTNNDKNVKPKDKETDKDSVHNLKNKQEAKNNSQKASNEKSCDDMQIEETQSSSNVTERTDHDYTHNQQRNNPFNNWAKSYDSFSILPFSNSESKYVFINLVGDNFIDNIGFSEVICIRHEGSIPYLTISFKKEEERNKINNKEIIW